MSIPKSAPIYPIIDPETTETQAALEKRLLAQLKFHLDLFEDIDSNIFIEHACDAQSDRIAYVEKTGKELVEMTVESVSSS